MKPLASYLRSHRRKRGLSQRELAVILGMVSENQISRHERSVAIPTLLVALGYEIIFRVPRAELFPGVYEAVKQGVEERLGGMESQLQESTGKGRQAPSVARKLEWLCERGSSDQLHPSDAGQEL